MSLLKKLETVKFGMHFLERGNENTLCSGNDASFFCFHMRLIMTVLHPTSKKSVVGMNKAIRNRVGVAPSL